MTVHEIERVSVATLGRVIGVVGAAMAIIFGIPFLLLGAFFSDGGITTYLLAIVFGASVGYVAGAATGLVYNAFAGTVGGLVIELSDPLSDAREPSGGSSGDGSA